MKRVRFLCLAGVFAICLPSAQAGTFVLNANAECWNVNDGLSFLSDPQTATFNAPGSASIVSQTSMPGISAFMNVHATMTDEYHGSIHYHDGWDTQNLTSGQVRFFGTSSTYSFATAGDAQVDVLWNSSFLSGGQSLTGFGLFDVHVLIDGTLFSAPDVWPIEPSGHWALNVGAGDHTITFWDQSNIWGALNTQHEEFTETLDFSVSPVPEPASIAAFGLGLAALARRRRA